MKSNRYSIKRTQVYGMRCTGTNYMDALIRNNFPSLELASPYDNSRTTFGWKHADVNTPGYSELDGNFIHKLNTPLSWSTSRDTLLIVMYRNPFSWLQSLHDHPWHAPEFYGLTFSEFLRHEWIAYYSHPDKEQSPELAVRLSIMRKENLLEAYRSVMEMRQAKIRIFESFKDRFYNVAFINYEVLNRDPESVTNNLSDVFDLERTAKFIEVDTYKGGTEKYEGSKYETVSTRDLHFILSRTDWAQESSVGYMARSGAWLMAYSAIAQKHPDRLARIMPRHRFYVSGEQQNVNNDRLPIVHTGRAQPTLLENWMHFRRAVG